MEQDYGVIELVGGPSDGVRLAVSPPQFPDEWISASINPADCIYDAASGQMRVPIAKVKRFVYARSGRVTDQGAVVYAFSRRLT